MKRALAKTAASFLVLIVSATTAPRLVAQQSSTTSPNTPSQDTPPPAQQSPAGTTQQAPGATQQNPSNNLPPIELPENPGHSSTSQPTAPAQAPQQQAPAQPAPSQPSGTAVAPPIEVSGGAASKPAGVAIAPPKQRQIRSLLIKLGLLAGAGVAVGTVVALSAASPGHVPNTPGH